VYASVRNTSAHEAAITGKSQVIREIEAASHFNGAAAASKASSEQTARERDLKKS